MDNKTFEARFNSTDVVDKTMQQIERIGIEKDTELHHRLKDYALKGYFGLKTPHLAMETTKSLPISCFLTAVGKDDAYSIVDTFSEACKLSVAGGGVSIDLDVIAPKGTVVRNGMATTKGVKNFIDPAPALINSYRQFLTQNNKNDRSTTWCFYLSASHGDAIEILSLFDKRNDDNRFHQPNVRLCIKFTQKEWNVYLDGAIDQTSTAIEYALQLRYLFGNINMMHKDNMQQKRKPYEPYEINSSNICTEIALPSNDAISSVCALININTVALYDMIKEPTAFDDPYIFIHCMMFLGRQMLLYTRKTIEERDDRSLKKILKGIEEYQSIGLCLSGINDILLKEKLAIGDLEAEDVIEDFLQSITLISDSINKSMYRQFFKEIHDTSHLRVSQNYFSRIWTIPPNSNSRQTIDITCLGPNPLYSNYYQQQSGSHATKIRNKYLPITDELVWQSIKSHMGSVQHLPDRVLSPELKEVFKTAFEVDQEAHLLMCEIRNVYLDHCQSIDLFIDKDKYDFDAFVKLHTLAWNLGIPTLYYCYFKPAVKQVEILAKVDEDCKACIF